MSTHFSDEELVDRLYGIGRTDTHLEECERCRQRWLRLQARRRELLMAPEIPADFLAAQRRRVYQRLEQDRDGGWAHRFTPAFAALVVIALGVVLSRPAPSPQPTLAFNGSDFYTEIYSMVNSTEPLAAEPIHGLFED